MRDAQPVPQAKGVAMSISPEQIRSFCDDFYINQKLAFKMDLPGDRETVMHLFDRVRADLPQMDKFKRFSDELALESPRRDGQYQWLALRQQSVRSGHVNPATMDEAYRLHRLLCELTPYFLSISPLDVEAVELMFGFDLDCKTNHHQVVYEALVESSPLGRLARLPGSRPMDVQPVIGLCLPEENNLQVFFEIKTRTSPAQVRADRYRTEPISIYLSLRRTGPVRKVDELAQIVDDLRRRIEALALEKAVPGLIQPIRSAIQGMV
jgi:hypothetical protein